MIKKDSLKLVLFLLNFSFLMSCVSSRNIIEENWTHFFQPCEYGEVTKVNYELNIIKQKQKNDCWFACYAILKSWKDKKKYEYDDVKSQIGTWKQKITRNLGLWVNEQPRFIDEMNLGFYPPANYTYEAFVQMLSEHGPLMICMGKKGKKRARGVNHARILYKIECGTNKSETIFYLINPRRGNKEKWNAYDFFETFESEAKVIVLEHEKLTPNEKLENSRMQDAWRHQIIYIK